MQGLLLSCVSIRARDFEIYARRKRIGALDESDTKKRNTSIHFIHFQEMISPLGNNHRGPTWLTFSTSDLTTTTLVMPIRERVIYLFLFYIAMPS